MRRIRNRTLFLAALVAASLALIVLSQGGPLRLAQTVLFAPLQPIQRQINALSSNISIRTQGRRELEDLRERNRELERTLAAYQVDIVRLREIERDYERLAELVDYSLSNTDQDLLTADVISRDTSGFLRYVIINRGARDGIRVGQPVISAGGLVGRVGEVTATGAWVRLAIDQSSAVNARLQDSRSEGTIVGQLTGGMRMQFIPQEAEVAEGELALTSGLGGNYPPDIVIGQIASVRTQEAELFQEAEIRPTVDFDQLEIVTVITSFEPVDPSLFEETIEEESGGAGQ
jgi:rod shape-determining protein MreC